MRNKIKKIMQETKEVRLTYLFGSRVGGRTEPLSDYDIGVVVDRKMPYDFKYRLASELRQALNTERVDVVILNSAPIELVYNVIAAGKLVYEKSVYERVEFEAITLSKYFDYLPVLRKQRKEILEETNYERGIQRHREAFRKTERMLAELRATQKKKV